jgi:hypothetical protein
MIGAVVEIGPYLPVDLTRSYRAALPETDVSTHSSILAIQVTTVRSKRPVSSIDVKAGRP